MLKNLFFILILSFAASASFAEDSKTTGLVCTTQYVPLFNKALEGVAQNVTPISQALKVDELTGIKVVGFGPSYKSNLTVEVSGVVYGEKGQVKLTSKNFKMKLDPCGHSVAEVTPVD